ncbi:MAG: hypothetical protein D6814_16310, partial [Calditrichaeota bacterium]
MYAEVVFDLPISQKFTYSIPEEFANGVVQRGTRVFVPFGHRKTTGYVVGLTETAPADIEIKPIKDVLDVQPLLTEEILQLCEWIAGYYLCGLGEVLRAALPAGLTLEKKKVVELQKAPGKDEWADLKGKAPLQYKILRALQKVSKIRADSLKKRVGASGLNYSLQRLAAAGYIKIKENYTGRISHEKKVVFLKLTRDAEALTAKLPARATRMRKIVQVLQAAGGSGRQMDILKQAKAPIQSLKGLIQ